MESCCSSCSHEESDVGELVVVAGHCWGLRRCEGCIDASLIGAVCSSGI